MRRNPLEGCVRQGLLTRDFPISTRFLRGNVILDLLGSRVPVTIPGVGTYDIHILRFANESCWYALIFRGGLQKPWWTEDAHVQAACLQLYTSYKVCGTIIVTEVDSEMNWLYIPAAADPAGVVAPLLEGWTAQPPHRLNKSGPRSHVTCRFCAVQGECNRLDLENGQTDDWEKMR